LKVETTYKQILKIALPITLGGVAQTILNITDTAFLARVGEIELGAAAIGGVFYFVLVMLGYAISTGAQILISRRAGEGNHTAIGILFDHTLILLIAFGLLQFALMQLTPTFINLIIADKDIAAASNDYIFYRSFALVFSFMGFAARAFFVSISQTRIITYQALLCCVLNVVLDYILIFGKCGFEPMGIAGAAIATAISEIVSALYILCWAKLHRAFRQYNLFGFKHFNRITAFKIFEISLPVMIQHFLSMAAWFVFFVLMEKMGRHPLAISNIIRSCYMVMMTPVWGFAAASNSMVSNLIGQGLKHEVMPVIFRICKLSAGFILLFTIGLSFFPNLLLKLTTNDTQLIADSMQSFYIALAATVIFSVSMNLLSAISGTGDTRSALIIEISNITLYILYIFCFTILIKSTVEIVWLSEIIYWVSMGVWSYWYLRRGKWQQLVV
jgi:putative MATE family efflux protein